MASRKGILQARTSNAALINDQCSNLSVKDGKSSGTEKKGTSTSFSAGMHVYIPDKESAWLPAVITNIQQGSLTVQVENKHNLPKLQEDKTRKVPASQVVLRAAASDLSPVHNLAHLSPLSAPAVLVCLHERYNADMFYTQAGSTVVAVNPFKTLPDLYGPDVWHRYHGLGKQNNELPPHIYAVAEMAYQALYQRTEAANQSIIVSGESGAGKTVSAKHLMKYLVTVGNRDDSHCQRSRNIGGQVERRILDSNPILEAFGNATTLRNHNSSRFGKYIQLQFNRLGNIQGASIQTYLLEKTRVVHQAPDEHNFHIFYQLLHGLDQVNLERLYLDSCSDYSIASANCRDKDLDHLLWKETREALDDLGLPPPCQFHILQVLGAILHLCSVEFCMDEEDDDMCCINMLPNGSQRSAEAVSELLGMDLSSLEATLTHRRITATHSRRKSVFQKPCTLQETQGRRDCLSKLLYSRLFEWLVEQINLLISSKDSWGTVGLLDIYGFESFEWNSLEQLCINYANEKLQQHFVTHFLRDLQADYASEAIAWNYTEFVDNRPCLDLLEANPGIFALLNEECQLNRPSSEDALQERLLTTLCHSQHLIAPRKNKATFVVKHYAGQVQYSLNGLLDKNKDNIPVELLELLQRSSNPFLLELFGGTQTEPPGKKRKTVLAKFKASLDNLMETLSEGQTYYIRCIKPNTHSVPENFNINYVQEQLVACGVLETVDISKKGFPTRILYEEFLQQFSVILRTSPPINISQPSDGSTEDNKENELLFEPLDMLYMKQLNITPRRKSTPKRKLRRRAGLSSCDHTRKLCASIMCLVFGQEYVENPSSCSQFGRTKLFLKDGQIETLEAARLKALAVHTFTIQCAWRRLLRRKRRQRLQATIIIQSAVRGWLAREAYVQALHCRRRAAQTLQRAARRWLKAIHQRNCKQNSEESLESIDLQFCADGDSPRCHLDTPQGAQSAVFCTPQRPNSDTHIGCRTLELHSSPGVGILMSSPLPCNPRSQKRTRTGKDMRSSVNDEEDDSYIVTSENTQDGMVYHIIKSPEKLPKPKSATDAFRTVAAAVSASFLTQRRFQLAGAFAGIPFIEAQGGVVSRRRMPRVQIKFHTRANPLLLYGHYIPQREFQCSLTDCLLDFD